MTRRVLVFHKVILASTIAFVSLMRAANAQTAPRLLIVSPAAETVVQPGQTVQVIVSATNPSLLTAETIAGTGPVAVLPAQNAASRLAFNVTIPGTTQAGTYYITAVGGLRTGGIVSSDDVSIVVPFTASVSKLSVSNSPLVFDIPGVATTLDVSAATNQGTLTMNPRNLSFVSGNPGVASVDTNGTVTAQGSGQTQIGVTYGTGISAISTAVPVQVRSGNVRGDLNGDGQIDIDDLNRLARWLNTPASGPNDARDLNHDGKIDALDAQALMLLCTYPECATKSGPSLTIATASASPNVLGPPYDKMHSVTLTITTSGGQGAPACHAAWVASNEPADRDKDWQITGDLTLNLRADQPETGNGRVYTIGVECRDGVGNGVIKSLLVTVPRGQDH